MSAAATDAQRTSSTTSETPASAPSKSNSPSLTVPQLLAFAAFVVFVIFALLADATNPNATVRGDEFEEVRKFTIFLIAGLLPSDALIRFGRNLLFQSIPTESADNDAAALAQAAPSATVAQLLAFGAFAVVAALTLVSNSLVSTAEFAQVNEVARTLVIALLPSDAALRFGRALYYRAPTTPRPNLAAMKLV